MADHSVNGTGSGTNGHSQSRNYIGRDSPPDSTARGLDRLPEPLQTEQVRLRLSAVRRIFVANTELRIAMAPPQSAEVTTTPQVVEVTLGEFRRFLERRAEVTTTPQNVEVTLGDFRRVRRFLERRQEQAALHQADAPDPDEVATGEEGDVEAAVEDCLVHHDQVLVAGGQDGLRAKAIEASKRVRQEELTRCSSSLV
ncbi:uncharacterized protein CPUR_04897 [Claviceps purpurea 20.1]|uniref:Uncharacterized protein n=1 Tax=Claviceps purpurea (strain 20.1) TaxID=1111077 RepID=M1W1L7_CLAP2|nr:hypothetical protein E4U36_005519 [Claviceps purpurea]KAG6266212.1 hypothetical protein E4U48_005624 [Claviceps purpurea]CCE31046.1 uncharacterized protein CPUR_04897 [Claviceps purpurea 20.1]